MLEQQMQQAETVESIVDKKKPAVSVSLDQLRKIQLGPKKVKRHAADWYYKDAQAKLERVKARSFYKKQSPFDEWDVIIYQNYTINFRDKNIYPNRNVDEIYRPALLVDWMPYITTTFLQDEPAPFLEHLRLIQSAKNNPWVEPVFYSDKAEANKRFVWADTTVGTESAPLLNGYPSLSLYPHTYTVKDDKPALDLSITRDRFQETVIYDALDKSFTILDIARTNDPEFLAWAHKKVLNRSPYIKSQIDESSIVKIYKDGEYVKSVSIQLHPALRKMLREVVDDALALVRPQRHKLAARTIEVKALKARGITPEFIGPEELNPLRIAPSISTSQFNIDPAGFSLPPVMRDAPADAIESEPDKPGNMTLPIVGAAAAAIGLYAATR